MTAPPPSSDAVGRRRPPGAGTTLLQLVLPVEPDRRELARMREAAAGVADWPGIVAQAEVHGLAPLLYRNLRNADADVPHTAQRQLRALYARHRHANAMRLEALEEILVRFEQCGIEALVLKGAALCKVLYPEPALRPMSDLDILVRRSDGPGAQAVLRELGYRAADHHNKRTMRRHHHLPAADRLQGGVRVVVEVHQDALARDCPASLPWAGWSRPPRRVRLATTTARVLGHEDMLWHLCWHAILPAARLRRIWLVDIVSYADRFAPEIDWRVLHQRYGFVIHMLSMIHFAIPLPPAVRAHVPLVPGPAPAGVGVVHKPLSAIFFSRRGLRDRFADLFYPSDWWLRTYYSRPEGSLAGCRWFRHPWELCRWCLRRLR